MGSKIRIPAREENKIMKLDWLLLRPSMTSLVVDSKEYAIDQKHVAIGVVIPLRLGISKYAIQTSELMEMERRHK